MSLCCSFCSLDISRCLAVPGLCSFWLMGSGWFGLVLGLMGIGVGMAFIDAPVAALLAGTLWTGKGSGTVFNSRLMSSIPFFSPLCSPFFFLLFALSLSLLVFSLGWHSWFCFSCFSFFLFQTSWICVGTATVLEVSTRFRTRRYRWGLRWVLCSGLGFSTRWKRILPKYVAKRVLEGGG